MQKQSWIEGDDRLGTSDAAPVACLSQNKVMFLLKVILIFDEPLLGGEQWQHSLVLFFLSKKLGRVTRDVCLVSKGFNKDYYYSFKIFLRFWLPKIPRIIHHNKLLTTKFGRILRYVKNDVNRAAKLPDYWTVNREDLGTRLSSFGGDYKIPAHFTRFTSKANYWLKT